MIKDIIKFTLLGGLFLGGHYFLGLDNPQFGSTKLIVITQLLLLALFLKSYILTVVLSEKFKILKGQLFLGFSVVKFIFAGLFIFFLKKKGIPVEKPFILMFMLSYFSYLALDVISLIKILKKEESSKV